MNDERIVYAPTEAIEVVIATCPDNDWRLVFALPGYAGVRFPSEVEDLKWSDIDWESLRIVVHEKKGVEVWPKQFVNLRGSCTDDLERRGVAEKAIDAWIGNLARMRRRHYHSVRPEDSVAVTGKRHQIRHH